MDGPISTGRDVGIVEESDVRQGGFYLHCSELSFLTFFLP